jgi:hypothetical protein
MMQLKLMNKFGKEINHMSCVYLHDGENVLRNLVGAIKEKTGAIEIGTYNGVSACILADYFDSVHTIDIEKQKLTDQIIDFAGQGKVKSYIVKDRKDEVVLVKELLDKNNINFAFIDGEHFHGELKKDFEMVKECKYILVHDYNPEFHEVYDFCNNVKGYDKTEGDNFCLLIKKATKPVAKGKKSGRTKKQ